MALITIQHSPCVTGSPQSSNSDGEADDDEGNQHHHQQQYQQEHSECFFASKGTALVLALQDIPKYSERRLSTDSIRSTNSTQSTNSDIQLHLQSMFNLLQQEETLKMAVKLESQRPNRTRYLVIVSRTGKRRSKTNRHKANSTTIALNNNPTTTTVAAAAAAAGAGNNSNAGGAPQRQLSVDSQKLNQQSQIHSANIVEGHQQPEQHPISTTISPNLSSNRQSVKSDSEKDNLYSVVDGKPVSTVVAITATTTATGVEESCLLGIDCNERTTIGLVVPILADTTIHLDGDGGFSVSVYNKTHIFKPVSVQAMWSALQTLHKVSQKARENNFYPGGPSHDWLSHYESHVESDQSCLNEWNAMDSLESRRPPSPDAIRNKPTAREETEGVIRMKLKEIMMSVDLDEVTSKYIRSRLEELLDMDLGEYKSFLDCEMLTILGQMDAPTEIFDHVYLGSEWNASNLEELQKNGVRHILNVTREIDNFFPGTFDYFNVRVYDDEKTNLLKYWDNTYRYITRAKAEGSKVLVHCKMGVSRSASVVIAYAMKAYNWEFQQAMQHVKKRRNCIKPNKNFLNQLETYRGMLDAMKNKEKLQRSKSETNLKSTKDARLLPGSEPTPLIQALNQAKSKSTGEAATIGNNVSEPVRTRSSQHTMSKQRRLVRRSSSTSPKTQTAVVTKQQSQSLENLTPERSASDEPRNVRFPGSNGENYSVTQNQVLHIQKNPPTSVKTRVHDLEAHQDKRRNVPPRFARSCSHDVQQHGDNAEKHIHIKNQGGNKSGSGSGSGSCGGGLVWTSSAKLLAQTASFQTTKPSDDGHFLGNSETEKRHRRKTQSWTESCGEKGNRSIILDTGPTTASVSCVLRAHSSRQREQPSRHSSWGSGDNRCSLPLRNSSWSYYDTNRNAAATAIYEGQIHNTHNDTMSTTMSNKTANKPNTSGVISHLGTVKRTKQKLEESTTQKKLCQGNDTQKMHFDKNFGELQKRNSNLQRSASSASSPRGGHQPLRCNSEEFVHNPSSVLSDNLPIMVRHSDGSRPNAADLFTATTLTPYTHSDIENKNTDATDVDSNMVVLRCSVQCVPISEDQRISGNVQILKQNFEAKAVSASSSNTVLMGSSITGLITTGSANAAAALLPLSKKEHQSLPSSPVAQHAEHLSAHATAAAAAAAAEMNAPKICVSSSSSSSSSSVPTKCFSSSSSSSAASSYSSSANCAPAAHTSETCDRNVKGLVHKYQTTKTSGVSGSGNSSSNVQMVCPTAKQMLSNLKFVGKADSSIAMSKPRPRSYYDKTNAAKIHDFNNSRPPPAPSRTTTIAATATTTICSNNQTTEGSSIAAQTQRQHQHHHQQHQQHQSQQHQSQQHQPQLYRRLPQHGKTHPLTRLGPTKQSFNTAAYNTM